jgi:TetR/AcrR family transcriptional regulator, transcriptional repressor for nem operon
MHEASRYAPVKTADHCIADPGVPLLANNYQPGVALSLTNLIVPISMYIMTTKRDDILDAAKTLLWEKGYDATSPRAIQDLSQAGQGSFYHHFKSKKDLAATTLEAVVDERIANFDALFGDSGPVAARLKRFLLAPRDELKGCRIGRMVWDSAIGELELRRPIERYFRHVESRIVETLEGALASGEIEAIVPPEQVAATVLATIQGALTLGRAMQDPKWYARTIQGAVSFINSVLKPSD